MFRKIRRIKNEIPLDAAKELLKNNMRGALAVNGDDGYPYTIPIDFYYDEEENKIFFHSAKAGHKIESIQNNDKVCFTTWNDGYKVEGDWAFYVSSCVVFGRAHIIEDSQRKAQKVREFALKYYPTSEEADDEIARDLDHMYMVEITIEHISGKKIHEK